MVFTPSLKWKFLVQCQGIFHEMHFVSLGSYENLASLEWLLFHNGFYINQQTSWLSPIFNVKIILSLVPLGSILWGFPKMGSKPSLTFSLRLLGISYPIMKSRKIITFLINILKLQSILVDMVNTTLEFNIANLGGKDWKLYLDIMFQNYMPHKNNSSFSPQFSMSPTIVNLNMHPLLNDEFNFLVKTWEWLQGVSPF